MTLKELEARVSAAEPNGMLKINIDHDGEGNEGIWACFATMKDKETYARNVAGEDFEVFLLNAALISGPTWGARLKLKANGGDRRVVVSASNLCQQMNEAVAAGDYPTLAELRQSKDAAAI